MRKFFVQHSRQILALGNALGVLHEERRCYGEGDAKHQKADVREPVSPRHKQEEIA